MNNLRKNLEPKQIIVVRKDLQMDYGKFGAQVSHAAMGCLTNLLKKDINNNIVSYLLECNIDSPMNMWIGDRFTKIIVEAKNEDHLLRIHKKAEEMNINNCLIQDAAFTVFDAPTYTCLGLGPEFPDIINPLTKRLRLYKG